MFKKLKAIGKAIIAVLVVSTVCILFFVAIPILLTILAMAVIGFIGYIVYKINADPTIKEEIDNLLNRN